MLMDYSTLIFNAYQKVKKPGMRAQKHFKEAFYQTCLKGIEGFIRYPL